MRVSPGLLAFHTLAAPLPSPESRLWPGDAKDKLVVAKRLAPESPDPGPPVLCAHGHLLQLGSWGETPW